MESYAHKAAKAVVVGWLRDAMAGNDGWDFCGLSGRVNRGAPHYGVWEEYPVCEGGIGSTHVWDEYGWETHLDNVRIHGSAPYAEAIRTAGRDLWLGMKRTKSGRFLDRWAIREKPPVDSFDELHIAEPSDRPPTYEELGSIGLCPRVILDIAIQHKGAISYGIEIVHKHDLTSEKREFLRTAFFPTIVLSAGWVLSQVEVPQRLVIREFIGGECGSSRIPAGCEYERVFA